MEVILPIAFAGIHDGVAHVGQRMLMAHAAAF
jgi:hypothetical protein